MARTKSSSHPGVGAQDVLIEEEQGVERLVLGGCSDLTPRGQIGEEFVDLRAAHLARVAFAVEQDESPDPIQVGLLGAIGQVMEPEHLAALVEEACVGIWPEAIEPAARPAGIPRIGTAGRPRRPPGRVVARRRSPDDSMGRAWAMRRRVKGLALPIACVIQRGVEGVVHKRFNP